MSAPGQPDIAGVAAPPPLVFLSGLLLGWLLQWLFPFRWMPPAWARPLGAAFFVAGLIGIAGVRAFARAGTPPNPWRPVTRLVTGGPYRFTRNPMYLGFTLWYLAVAAWFNALCVLLVLPFVLFALQRGVIRREEAYLRRRFGQEYEDYCARVRRGL
jgi:protein-S-isoprenylcysteine O-methyltransferase Ste14